MADRALYATETDKGARLVLDALPPADHHGVPRGTRGQRHRAVHPVIEEPQVPFAYDKALYRQRHKVENLFDAHPFFSAICIAAIDVMTKYWKLRG